MKQIYYVVFIMTLTDVPDTIDSVIYFRLSHISQVLPRPFLLWKLMSAVSTCTYAGINNFSDSRLNVYPASCIQNYISYLVAITCV